MIRCVIVVLLAGLAVAGCGASARSPASTDPAMQKALAQVKSVIDQAAQPAKALPEFKVAPAAARLHGLDLWDAIVFPMIRPLHPLDGQPALRSKLNGPQYAVYVLFSVDDDIDDGGLWEVYYNASGVFAQQAVSLLRTVGAPRHAAVLARANRIAWPAGGIPSSEGVRRSMLGGVTQSRYDGVNDQWAAADRREGSLETIIERYVRRHPSAFFS